MSPSIVPFALANERHKVLVVDDEDYLANLVCKWLEGAGYECVAVYDGLKALEQAQVQSFDLVVADINMPGMSGLELLEELKRRQPHLAVIMATAVADREVAIDAVKKGAYGYIIKPMEADEMLINAANALERRRLELLGSAYQQRLELDVRERTRELRETREEISLLLVTASESRDLQTGGHVRRMGLYAEAFANALGWGHEVADQMRLAAPMHDVGKIGVPDHILLKPGRLTDTEFEAVKRHVDIGAQILAASDLPLLELARDIVLSHHERWDGSGYPKGLSGKNIPREGRLVAITDVYDALTHDRVYRPAIAEDRALQIMHVGRGSHFDPEMFDAFLVALPTIRRIRENAT